MQAPRASIGSFGWWLEAIRIAPARGLRMCPAGKGWCAHASDWIRQQHEDVSARKMEYPCPPLGPMTHPHLLLPHSQPPCRQSGRCEWKGRVELDRCIDQSRRGPRSCVRRIAGASPRSHLLAQGRRDGHLAQRRGGGARGGAQGRALGEGRGLHVHGGAGHGAAHGEIGEMGWVRLMCLQGRCMSTNPRRIAVVPACTTSP